jgi:putative endonuclease
MSGSHWIVYLVRCSDNSLYCGISNDLKNRLKDHNSGRGARYTKFRRPVVLVGVSPEMTKSEALKLEYMIKQLPADKKIAELKRNENVTAILKKDLQSLQKEIMALKKNLEKLITAAEKSEKHETAMKTTAKSG